MSRTCRQLTEKKDGNEEDKDDYMMKKHFTYCGTRVSIFAWPYFAKDDLHTRDERGMEKRLQTLQTLDSLLTGHHEARRDSGSRLRRDESL